MTHEDALSPGRFSFYLDILGRRADGKEAGLSAMPARSADEQSPQRAQSSLDLTGSGLQLSTATCVNPPFGSLKVIGRLSIQENKTYLGFFGGYLEEEMGM